jgi:zinc protease
MSEAAYLEKYNSLKTPKILFEEHTLNNGLRVILSRSERIPTVVINTAFHTGSKDDGENTKGMAHLFEHLMFEGSPNVPHGKFDEILHNSGGESNAYTSWDSTSYYMVLPSNHLETGLWLDSDRIAGFSISEEALSTQKDVITEEKMLVCDNTPYGSLEEESAKRLFKSSGYRWPIIGDMEHLRNVDINKLKNFFDKYYSPSNAVLSIVGDLDYDKTLKLIEKYYGKIPGSAFKNTAFYNDDFLFSETRENIYDNVQLEGKFIFYLLPEAGSREFYSMNILNGILTEGDSSRFYNELEYRSELVNEIDSTLYGMEKVSIFLINAIANKGKDLQLIENKIDEILDDIHNGNIMDHEIKKIKNKIETFYNIKRQSLVSLADKFSHLKIFYDDCDLINNEIIKYLEITKEDIIEVANKFLNKNQRLVLNYLPKA